MQTNVHPNYNPAAQVVCSCGNMFTVGSTKGTIYVELCYNCHPFYTGQQKFVDTASRIERFQKKMATVQPPKKKVKETQKTDEGPKTLREMLESLKKQ